MNSQKWTINARHGLFNTYVPAKLVVHCRSQAGKQTELASCVVALTNLISFSEYSVEGLIS
jgi:hypothetical protein